jgi:hypothetical protein
LRFPEPRSTLSGRSMRMVAISLACLHSSASWLARRHPWAFLSRGRQLSGDSGWFDGKAAEKVAREVDLFPAPLSRDLPTRFPPPTQGLHKTVHKRLDKSLLS